MTPISDDMVERGAIGLDADLFVRDKYYDHPNVVRKRNDALETSRIVLTAGLKGSVAVPAWQPIETAPKDQFIILYCPEDDSTWWAMWQGHRWFGSDEFGLRREGMGPEDVTGWKVTHWMPRPAIPRHERTTEGTGR